MSEKQPENLSGIPESAAHIETGVARQPGFRGDGGRETGLTRRQAVVKRAFDVVVSLLGLFLVWPFILIGWIAATISTRTNGFFVQRRIGLHGETFSLIKLRSMRKIAGIETSVTADNDVRITRTGRILRKLKLDELPQLVNVFLGQMSIVGPRPDVPGFADQLQGDDRIVLSVRPGITGPASIAFRHEEDLLAAVEDPEAYNRDVIWPEKVRLNRHYIENYNLTADFVSIWQTLFGGPTFEPTE